MKKTERSSLTRTETDGWFRSVPLKLEVCWPGTIRGRPLGMGPVLVYGRIRSYGPAVENDDVHLVRISDEMLADIEIVSGRAHLVP